MKLPRVVESAEPSRTFTPPKRLVLARACVEAMRIIPLMIIGGLGMGVSYALEQIRTTWG